MAVILKGVMYVGNSAVTASLVQAEIEAMLAFGNPRAESFVAHVRQYINESRDTSLTVEDFESTAVNVLRMVDEFRNRNNSVCQSAVV